MTASLRTLRTLHTFFASIFTPFALRPGTVVSLLLAIGVACAPHAAAQAAASFSGGFEVLGGQLTYPSGIAVDTGGNIYLAMPDLNAVQEIPASCITGANDGTCIKTLGGGFSEPQGVAVDTDGNVYVADTDNNAVKEIPATCITHANNASCVITLTSSFNQPYGVAVDAGKNVYVADTFQGKVQKILASCIVANDYSAADCIAPMGIGSVGIPTAVAVDGSGNVYVGDTGNSIVEMLSSCAYTTSPSSRYTCTATTLSSGFVSPYGISVDASGNVFVADVGTSKVSEILAAGGYTEVRPIGGNFDTPNGVAVDANDNVYVADTTNNQVKMLWLGGVNFGSVAVNTSSPTLRTLIFTFTAAGTIGAPAILTEGAALLDFTDAGTGSCTTNGIGHTYNIGDVCTVNAILKPLHPGERNGAVQLKDNSNNVLATVFIHGVGTGPLAGFSPGTVSVLSTTPTSVDLPKRMVFDSQGNLYEADYGSSRVLEIAPNGVITELVPASAGMSPAGVALDGAGNLYIADQSSSAAKVWKLTPGGTPTALSTSGLGTALNTTKAVTVDGSGNVYAADTGNNRIVVFPSGGTPYPLTLTGTALGSPWGISIDSAGNLFIADENGGGGSGQILQVSSGFTTTGTASVVSTGSLSPALNLPKGVNLDAMGNLYVSDSGNNRIVEIPSGSTNAIALSLGSYTLTNPVGVAVSNAGDLYIADGTGANGRIVVSSQETAPTISFPTTTAYTNSTALPVTLMNLGNAALNFSIPESGTNPSLSLDYTLGTSSDPCPQVQWTDSIIGSLAANSSCVFEIEFSPTVTTADNGTLTLTDNSSGSSSQTVSLVGSGVAPTITVSPTSAALPDGTYGSAYSENFTASGGEGAYTYSGSVSPTGSGLTLSSSGVLSGTAAAGNSYGITVTATDEHNFSGSQSYTLVIDKATASFSFTPYSVNYDGNAHTASGTASGVGSIDLSADLTLSGTTHTAAGDYPADAWSFHDSTGNYADASGTLHDIIAQLPATATAPVPYNFSSVNVGSSATYSVTFNIVTVGAIGVPVVVTEGATGLDFTDAGTGTCTLNNGNNYDYAAGSTCTVDVTFTPRYPGLRYGTVLLEDTSNNILATAYVYGTGTGAQVNFSPGTPSTLAQVNGHFNGLYGVAVDASGNVFVADDANNKVKEIVAAGGYVTVNTLAVDNGNFSSPTAVAVDGAGNVFVTGGGDNTVKEIVAVGGYTTVNTLAVANGHFNAPGGVAVDGSGNLFISDWGNSLVKEIVAAGGYTTVNTLAPAYSGSTPTTGFSAPSGVEWMAAGTSSSPIKAINW